MRLARRWNRHVTGAMHEEGAMHSIAVAAVLKTPHAAFLDHARRQICLWPPRIPISVVALPAPSGQGSFLRCQAHSELIQPRTALIQQVPSNVTSAFATSAFATARAHVGSCHVNMSVQFLLCRILPCQLLPPCTCIYICALAMSALATVCVYIHVYKYIYIYIYTFIYIYTCEAFRTNKGFSTLVISYW
jgi:hypothetical protein